MQGYTNIFLPLLLGHPVVSGMAPAQALQNGGFLVVGQLSEADLELYKQIDATNARVSPTNHCILPFLGLAARRESCSVVVLDNCPIRSSNYFIKAVRRKGDIAMFLP